MEHNNITQIRNAMINRHQSYVEGLKSGNIPNLLEMGVGSYLNNDATVELTLQQSQGLYMFMCWFRCQSDMLIDFLNFIETSGHGYLWSQFQQESD